jgi:anti-sigma factor RsiW
MNCGQVTERMAAYLDGQLAPAEAEQLSEHLHGCTPCHQICDAMMGQDFAPMSAAEKDEGCGAEGFWDAMDTALDSELAALTPMSTSRGQGARIGLPMTVALAYAAALLLAVTWGYQHMERADSAEETAQGLQQQLEQERRLAADPQAVPGVPEYRPVVYTPQRSTF